MDPDLDGFDYPDAEYEGLEDLHERFDDDPNPYHGNDDDGGHCDD